MSHSTSKYGNFRSRRSLQHTSQPSSTLRNSSRTGTKSNSLLRNICNENTAPNFKARIQSSNFKENFNSKHNFIKMNPNSNESNSQNQMPLDPSVNNVPNMSNIVNSANIPQNIPSLSNYQFYQPQIRNANPALQIRTPDQQLQFLNPFYFSMMTQDQYNLFMQHAFNQFQAQPHQIQPGQQQTFSTPIQQRAAPPVHIVSQQQTQATSPPDMNVSSTELDTPGHEDTPAGMFTSPGPAESTNVADSTNDELQDDQTRDQSPDIIEVHPSQQTTTHRSRRGKFCEKCVQDVFNIEGDNNNPLLQGIPQLFTPGLLAELTTEDKVLNNLREAARNKDFEKFKNSAKNVAQFYKLSAEMNDILVVDNRLAIPEKLRNAVLNWLHKDHPGQLAMLDAANYIWWPKMHSQIVEKAESCRECRQMGKNLKTLIPKTAVSKYPEPCAPNDELQLDFAGPLFANSSKSTYIFVAIDSYSRFPSAMISKSTDTNKIS